MSWGWHLLVVIEVYGLLALSLNLALGLTGLVSLSTAAFYGVGAYTSALAALHFRAPVWISIPMAVLMTLVVALVVALPLRRLQGDGIILATIGFQLLFEEILRNWTSVTHGSVGLVGIPRGSVLGFSLEARAAYAAFTAVGFGAGVLLHQLISRSPFGRIMRAIRDDRGAASAVGISGQSTVMKAFALSAALAGLAGAFYAHYATYIDPSSFSLKESILVLTVVVFGGAGNLAGPLLGTVVITLLPEAIRLMHVPDSIAANLRECLYASALIVLMFIRPRGLAGEFDLR